MAPARAGGTPHVLVPVARAGYAARGVVYLIVGVLAVYAAFGRGETTGSRGAMSSLLQQPFGRVLVWAMVVGLFAFGVWRLVQALFDPDHHGTSAKGLGVRAGLLASSVVYAALGTFTLGLVSVWGSDGGGDPTGPWLAAIARAGWGQAMAWALVLVLVVVAGAHFVKGWKAHFERYFDAPEERMRIIRPISRIGLIARGVTFLILAFLVWRGGLAFGERGADPQPPGLADALVAVQGWPAGWAILAVIALGLIAFGVYSLAEAVWRRIIVPPEVRIGL